MKKFNKLEDEIDIRKFDFNDLLEKSKVIHMGNGKHSVKQVNFSMSLLDTAFGIMSGLQQGGLQGTEPDSGEFIANFEHKIQTILQIIIKNLGQNIVFVRKD